ncbi:TIGR03085 family metal-binding protein [Actinomycetospora termitidis]|uniref:TIGR03085 family metal-binding protein n=1 Tax=Actinomycetospora termitidis TaxID=3053470 RepID=A0ABT7M799_9PSEU|nr:TIGR03085 family metal-binding protein [Actinomycetospora sp. Odt1-22]MDL5156326.1 TIGR03085 family metal-binding protein [Actinomycetospora sp. Odt1-22]
MSGASVAAAERNALADSLLREGPDAPTLCGDWTTRDLLAHLVIRERRPDAAPGILVKPLSFWTERVQSRQAAHDYGENIALVRSGPPLWSPIALPFLVGVDVQEYFIHHEDVRRAQESWSPRPADEARDAILWSQLGMLGKLAFRSSPQGVTLRRPDGAEHAVKAGPRTVTITGEPGELVLYASGREQAVVSFDGEPADVAAVKATDRGL